MKKNNRTRRIEARVTEEEYQKYKKKAEEKGMTITALIRNSLERSVVVKINTDTYRELVLEVRRIGNNINQILRRINQTQYYTQTDINLIIKNQQMIDELLQKETLYLNQVKNNLNSYSTHEISKLVKEIKKRG